MKLVKSRLHMQRRHLEKKLEPLSPLAKITRPPSGWIQAIRESLGLTARQLGAHLGMSAAGATKLEQRERARTITLRDMDRAASVLNCRVVYALVPNGGLEATLRARAEKTAERLSAKAQHAMRLEAQPVARDEQQAQREELARRLLESLDARLWEVPEKKRKAK